MVIGPVNAGKTTLLKALDLVPRIRKKTPMVMFCGDAIDTPGEAFEIPGLYHTIIQTSNKAALVLLIADPVRARRFPKGFLKVFRGQAWGIINKIDMATEKQAARARVSLEEAGVEDIFSVSALSGEGIDELKARISTILGRCSVHER
jgi:ethanolamine utilization protein EutP